jgi:soluble lytic murein transglycosylase-like protein
MIKLLVLLIVGSLSIQANADCFDRAGEMFNVNPDLLKAIAYTESRINQNAINYNRNKAGEIVSADYGVMQVNSTWFPVLEKYGITSEMVINDMCINIEAGTWILASNLAHSGDNWLAVGAYNAGYKKTKAKERIRQEYITLVQSNLRKVSEWQD